MQEVFEKIIHKLDEECFLTTNDDGETNELSIKVVDLKEAIEIAKKVAAEYNNGWIPCDWTTPRVETEVLILAKRKHKGGRIDYITTTAMYENGTVLENDSCWNWEDIDGEWDEENDCRIIPEGWWELRHYNRDEVYNNSVDDEVIAWQPLPEPYQPKGE